MRRKYARVKESRMRRKYKEVFSGMRRKYRQISSGMKRKYTRVKERR